ncbi:MAG: hypothetical protein EVA87_13655 [Rhodospirillaceae bacterium]|nr:MAG: hypothetical protein EVA87_13655 [Rhodospirillaceae bacterium]
MAVGQDLEITRSVNQYAFAPAIGGGQLKFEGFFRTCRDDGTRDGSQGAAVPVANEKNLVLTGEVADGKYAVWCIETIKDARELFTGVPAGTGDAKGEFGKDAVFGKSRH